MTDKIRTISPSTNKVICERGSITIAQAQDVFRAATNAFPSFCAMPFAQRKGIVQKALRLIQDRKGQLAEELTLQMGRPIAFGVKEIETMQKRADYLLGIAEEALQPLQGQPEAGFRRWIEKEPVGPTLIVFAWNVSCAGSPTCDGAGRLLTSASSLTLLLSIPCFRRCWRETPWS